MGLQAGLYITTVAVVLILQGAFSNPQGWNWDNFDGGRNLDNRSTTTTITARTSPTTPSSNEFDRCVAGCPVTVEYNPVCGTNGETYNNDNGLLCARKCGVDVQKSFNGLCTGRRLLTSTASPAIRDRIPANYTTCIRRCSVVAGYFAVCGSNGVTYENESRLTCDRDCGVRVTKLHEGHCRST